MSLAISSMVSPSTTRTREVTTPPRSWLPLVALSDAGRETVRRAMAAVGLIG